ncbi:hypothetical protein GQ457_18G014620 [Hibiscus cannabinus]
MTHIEQRLANLSIGSGEDDGVQIDLGADLCPPSFDLCFVGSFLTTSIINFSSMKSRMVNVWHPPGGISITDLGAGRFLFQLYHVLDVDRIEHGGPWSFNNHLLILHRLRVGEDPMLVVLHYVNLWVYVHEVPLGFMSEKVVQVLGNFIDSFISYESKGIALGYNTQETYVSKWLFALC